MRNRVSSIRRIGLWARGRTEFCAVAFIVGLCLGAFQSLTSIAGVGVLVVAIVLLKLLSARRVYFLVLVVAIGYLSAALQASAYRNVWIPKALEGQILSVSGMVVDQPINSYKRSKLLFKINDIQAVGKQINGAWRPLGGSRLMLNCYSCTTEFAPGQHWQLKVKLKRPHGYANWGGFDYEQFLFRQQIVGVGTIKEIEHGLLSDAVVGKRLESPAVIASTWRYQAVKKIRTVLDKVAVAEKPDASAWQRGASFSANTAGQSSVLALAFGLKGEFSTEQRQIMQVSGISHLMVISGLHIGLIFALVYALAGRLLSLVYLPLHYYPRQTLALAPALCGAVVYAAMAGFALSTQRAPIMLCLFSIFKVIGREASLIKVLALAALIIGIGDPLVVLDIGFWLSGGAVLVIAVWQFSEQKRAAYSSSSEVTLRQNSSDNTLDKPLSGTIVPNKQQQLLGSLHSLIGLQLMFVLLMLPVNAFIFGQSSLISLVVNLVCIPLFSLVLIPATLLVVGCLLMYPGFELALLALTYLTNVYSSLFSVLERVSTLPLGVLYLPNIGLLPTLLAVALFLLCLGRFRFIKLLLASILFVVGALLSTAAPTHKLFVTLLDVGQGLAMVIRAGGYTVVYDVGPRYPSGFNTADAVVLPYLRSIGVRATDLLIISHADNDHIGSLEAFLARMPTHKIFSSRPDKISKASACVTGQRWSVNGAEFTFVSPQQDTPQGSNNLSCVLKIVYAGTTVLLTGDIEKQVEQHLINTQKDLRADIMLVPHQGSKTSSTPEFIDAVSPQLALVAAGYLNQYKHPHPEVLQRYSERNIPVLGTPESGAIEVVVDRQGWSVVEFRSEYFRPWR